jgi:hypothetical protein
MLAAHTTRRLLARSARTVAATLLATGATAVGAAAATLSVAVPSHAVKSRTDFSVRLSGSYTKSELTGKAFLVAAFQYDRLPCRATAQAEFKLSDTSFFFFRTLGSSPFAKTASFTAGAPGARRICAYLYGRRLLPQDKGTPLVAATGFFRVVSRSVTHRRATGRQAR